MIHHDQSEPAEQPSAAVLMELLDDDFVPLHIRAGNTALTELLQSQRYAPHGRDPETVEQALRSRKYFGCSGCRGQTRDHVEDHMARAEDFTPGT